MEHPVGFEPIRKPWEGLMLPLTSRMQKDVAWLSATRKRVSSHGDGPLHPASQSHDLPTS